MLAFLIDPMHLTILLALLALATPMGAYALRQRVSGRRCILAGITGPAVLAFWGVHNAVLAVVGFDSVFSALIVLLLAAAAGALAARWVDADPASH